MVAADGQHRYMIIQEKPPLQLSCLMDMMRSSNFRSIRWSRKNVITAGNPTSLTSGTHSMLDDLGDVLFDDLGGMHGDRFSLQVPSRI